MSDYGVKTAKIYDPLLHIFIHSLRKKILKIIQENNYKNILDVCCGRGNQLKMLQKHGIPATGIDLSKEMLEVAKSGEVKAHCLEQNAENIDFRENSFDLVMTTFALHEKSNESARKILNEMIRVSQKNGHLMIVDYALPKRKLNISIRDRVRSGTMLNALMTGCTKRPAKEGFHYLEAVTSMILLMVLEEKCEAKACGFAKRITGVFVSSPKLPRGSKTKNVRGFASREPKI